MVKAPPRRWRRSRETIDTKVVGLKARHVKARPEGPGHSPPQICKPCQGDTGCHVAGLQPLLAEDGIPTNISGTVILSLECSSTDNERASVAVEMASLAAKRRPTNTKRSQIASKTSPMKSKRSSTKTKWSSTSSKGRPMNVKRRSTKTKRRPANTKRLSTKAQTSPARAKTRPIGGKTGSTLRRWSLAKAQLPSRLGNAWRSEADA